MKLVSRRIAAALAALPLLAALPAAAQVFNPDSFVLPNGMQVVVVPNHRVPVIAHMVWYKVGAADEQPGKTGLAHMLEHLMFKGTPTVPPGEFSKIVARHGGRDNAFTSSDYTAYFQNVAKEHLELVMKMEADRMANLRLEAKDFRPERDVVLEERRSRTDNDPASLLNERAEAMLFVNHPYRNPIIGWPQEVARLEVEDAIAFYKKYYAPNNAILIVAGDVTAAEVKPLAEKYYGAVAPRDVPRRIRPQEPPPMAERRLVMRHADVRQPSWGRRFQAPSYKAGDSKNAYALEVLSEVIGGSSTSRLYRKLVVDKQLATAAGAFYDASAVDLSTFGIYASPRPGVPIDRLEQAIVEELEQIAKGDVDGNDIERAKERLRANVAYARDSLQAGAYAFGVALTTGQSIEDVERWPERIAAVTADQVREAAKLVIRSDQSVTAVLLPTDERAAAQRSQVPEKIPAAMTGKEMVQ